MTAGILIAVLAALALAYVLAPVRLRAQGEESGASRAELEEKKFAALSAILDLESERDMGKLSENDLEELRRAYETEALDALAALDFTGLDERTDPLEREIAAVRARLEDPNQQ